jgi:hypothetical protein
MLFVGMISLMPIASGRSNIGPCFAFRLHDFVFILFSYVDFILIFSSFLPCYPWPAIGLPYSDAAMDQRT